MMKFYKLILLLALISTAICIEGCAKRGFEPMEQDDRIVSKDLVAELKERGGEYKDSGWPDDVESAKVDAAQIPDEVMHTAVGWLGVMIKDKWLPPDLAMKWIVGIHKKEYPRADYLIFRYNVAGHRIQVQEGGGTVHVLIEAKEAKAGAESVEDHIKRTIYEFLNYPEDKKDAFAFSMKSFEHDGRSFYYGKVDCDFDINDKEVRKRRAWWNHTFFWTDSKRTYFSLVERDGTPPSRDYPTPGSHPRFGIEWKGTEEVEYKVRQRQR